jgi:DNA-binding NarL/FixJ family response regulator
LNLIRQGASGYLNKECDPKEIVDAIRTISLGRRYITPAVAELLARQLDSQERRCCRTSSCPNASSRCFLKLRTG